jgi:hypothetical protein
MGKYTEIKRIRSNDIVVDYKIFDKAIDPVTFFIRVIKQKKIIQCSIYENMNDPFFQIDLSNPDYELTPLSQSSISQYVFVRGIMRIIKAVESDDFPDEVSICN